MAVRRGGRLLAPEFSDCESIGVIFIKPSDVVLSHARWTAGRLRSIVSTECNLFRRKVEIYEMRADWRAFNFGVPWEEGYGFSQAIRSGSTLYISGQLSHDMSANFVGEGEFELQVRTTFENLDKILHSYGASRSQIVATTVYVKNLRLHFDEINRLHKEYFGDHRPTSTLLGVAELAVPQQLVEISAVALLETMG